MKDTPQVALTKRSLLALFFRSVPDTVYRGIDPSADYPHAVERWADRPNWNRNIRHNAIGIVCGFFNWAVAKGKTVSGDQGKCHRRQQSRRYRARRQQRCAWNLPALALPPPSTPHPPPAPTTPAPAVQVLALACHLGREEARDLVDAVPRIVNSSHLLSLTEATDLTQTLWQVALQLYERTVTKDILAVRLLGVGVSSLTEVRVTGFQHGLF